VEVRLTDIAEGHAERIDAWWRKNRPAAPELFMQELGAVIVLLGTAPETGEKYRSVGDRVVRRALLERTRQWAFHHIDDGVVTVIAIWGVQRRRGPPLVLR